MTDLRLVLVRHGITDWNREGRFQGHLDPPLSEAGQHEAALVAQRIAVDEELRPGSVVASSLTRAFETARAIADAVGVATEPDRRLIEIGQGEWEGRTHADIEREDGVRYRAWRDAAGVRRPPGGETIDSAQARVGTLLDEVLRTRTGTVCLVSHGGAMRVLARLLFDLPDDRSWAFDIDNASVSVVTRSGTWWRLDRWNDTGHLLGREPVHVDEVEGRPLAL